MLDSMLDIFSVYRRRNQPATHDLFDRVDITCHPGILDIDFNLHMNNANYLKFMEKGRVRHALATGMVRPMFAERCNMVVANTEISYIRELRPYQPFSLQTRLLGWDEKYLYYDQRFQVEQGRLNTHSLVRVAVFHEKQLITPAAFQEISGLAQRSPALPEYIASWKAVLHDKKRYSQTH